MKRRLPVGPSSEISRRDALAMLAAMGTAAALPACRRPDERIVPYVRQPEEVVPGNPLHFATALALMGTAFGVVVENHEGRPTKIEGNPLHPESLGASPSFIQAEILGLYDSDRSRGPREHGTVRSWQEAEATLSKLADALANDKGRSLAVVTSEHRSPTFMSALRDVASKYPQALIARTEPFTRSASTLGLQWVFGRPLEAVYDLAQADVILSLEADFLGLEGSPVRSARDWSQRRDPDRCEMNRLYVFESSMSLTGSNADHRFTCSSSSILAIACNLLTALEARGLSTREELSQAIARIGETHAHPLTEKQVSLIAKDLHVHAGCSLVIAGERQPPTVHALAQVLNYALGNIGKSVRYVRPFETLGPKLGTLEQVAAAVTSGAIDTLLLFGVNPIYDAPGDVDVTAMLKQAALSIHVGTHFDETATLATWHLNQAHPLEAWSDMVSADGTVSIAQPMIAPLFGGRTDTEILRLLLGKKASDFEWVQVTWRQAWGETNFDTHWRLALHDGIVADSTLPSETVTPEFESLTEALQRHSTDNAMPNELCFAPDSHTYDGRFANNPWLLELPDPLTKLTWTNAARISPALARTKGLSNGDVVALHVGERSVQLPVLIAPGQADHTITVTIGHGRSFGVAEAHKTGANVNPLRSTEAPYLSTLSNIVKTGRAIHLPRTQEHFSSEGRPIALEGRTDRTAINSSNRNRGYPGERKAKGDTTTWGMAIDLGKCTGCNACIVACQAENNVSVVGAEGIRRNRAMHWLRIDRYFSGPEANPSTVAQPVLCQQCEAAPCESVCPVGATSHSPEGLNDMAYNRCVGSRYCAANCPFKVRRFNYFEYWNDISPTYRMQLNPDVTVRSRGVMEKCTFCVQRINKAKIEHKKLGTSKFEDGAVVTACEQACPSRALTFGNLNDPQSRVASLVNASRSYRLLDELTLRTHVSYLAKIRNPNPELEI